MSHEVRQQITRYIPVARWPEFHPWPTVAGMRHLIHLADSNGFARCIRRVNRKVLIDEAEFLAWVESRDDELKRSRGLDARKRKPTVSSRP